MPDYRYWDDPSMREALTKRGRAVFARIRADLGLDRGVVGIEPEGGEYFVGLTLGKANALAYNHYPDRWLYFVRIDDPSAEITLPTW